MKYVRQAFILGSLIFLSSCALGLANFRKERPIADLSKTRSICLISSVKDEVNIVSSGILGGSSTKVPEDWGLRKLSLDLMAGALNKRYQATSLDVMIQPFEAGTSSFDEIRSDVRKVTVSGKCDLILVLAAFTHNGIEGPSDFAYSAQDKAYEIEFSYIMLALDGSSYDVVGIQYAGPHYYTAIESSLVLFSPPVLEKYAEKREQVRAAILYIEKESIPSSVAKLGLMQ